MKKASPKKRANGYAGQLGRGKPKAFTPKVSESLVQNVGTQKKCHPKGIDSI